MSAEANIKHAYEHAGANVLSLKRQAGNTYRIEIEVRGRRLKQFAKDPEKSDWVSSRQFKKSLREINRYSKQWA